MVEVAGVQEDEGQDADEHQRRTRHRVDEELEGRVHTPLVTPTSDEEVHGDQHDLPEDEEQEEVESEEHAEAPGLEDEHPRRVRLDVVVGVGTREGEREQDSGEHDEEQRDSVDPEVPGDAPLLDPDVVRSELEPRCARGELVQRVAGEDEHGHRRREPHDPHQFWTRARDGDHQRGADGGNDNHRREERETNHFAMPS